jgi:hypothetical protein
LAFPNKLVEFKITGALADGLLDQLKLLAAKHTDRLLRLDFGWQSIHLVSTPKMRNHFRFGTMITPPNLMVGIWRRLAAL